LTVRFTAAARSQFLAALAYVAHDNPEAAKTFRRRSEIKLRRLERFPQSGRPIPEFPDLPHREVVIAPYRFFYRVQGRVVWVVGVWHGAQLPRLGV
jgi:toxin ParE1/3/4